MLKSLNYRTWYKINEEVVQHFNWQAISRDNRHQSLEYVKESISQNDGYIIGFQMYSDLAINLTIEMELKDVIFLYRSLSKSLRFLKPASEPSLDSDKDCIVHLNLSFTQGTGNLTQVIPDSPG